FPVSINSWLVDDDKGIKKLLCILVKNITMEKKIAQEKKILQEQLQTAQKMEAIGTLAGGIAHDFNNILGGIIGYAELAEDHTPDEFEKTHNDLKQILTACQRAKNLVSQILTFSRKDNITLKALDITDITKETLKLVEATIKQDIKIEFYISKYLLKINADATQIQQIILNLCTNAVHSMRGHGGILHLSLINIRLKNAFRFQNIYLEPGLYIRLIVKDSGHGMTPEIMNQIFDPYFTTKDVNEGTGLGLSVTLGIIKSYGGAIKTESVIGQGSTFTVLIPAIKSEFGYDDSKDVDIRGKNESILFIDDEKLFADAIKQHLVNLGYKIVFEQFSLKALEILKSKKYKFDLIIIDQSMPKMTGLQLAKEIMEINIEIPIILCTGFSEKISDNMAKIMGIKKIVKKPINKNELSYAIHSVLNKKDLI
ncbi:MAG: response regulator, partial [Desulfobacterales bacterium]|nr:response regulator [Desulfobacterales bacterium]